MTLTDKNIGKYTVRDASSLQDAAERIAATKGRIAFVVDHNGMLLATLTNGDLVRWVAAGSPGGAESSVLSAASRTFKFARDTDSADRVAALLREVLYVPLLDPRGRLVAVARNRDPDEGITIGDRRISAVDPVFVIAEIGNNHNGSLDRALKLIDAAADAGADCAKFQMRDMDTLYGGARDGSATGENLGTEYVLDLLARHQLSSDELFRCFDHCRSRGLVPLCTPWDEASFQQLEGYGMQGYKVASADITNHELLRTLATAGKPLICSTGMTAETEIRESVELLQRLGAAYVLLHCNSTYPAPFKDVNLDYIERLQKVGSCVVGYSGHERDIFVSVAAVTKGARVIEKHLTFDREMEGSDHRVSLLPDELGRLVNGIRQVEQALGTDDPRRLTQGEMMNRATLAKSVFATVDIPAGQVIEEHMLEVRSPGRGVQPNRKRELVGMRLERSVAAGTPFFPSDIDGDRAIEPTGRRSYAFSRPWGLPVRHHDFSRLVEASSPDFLEFHLSYRDLELVDDEYFAEPLPVDLVVHAPELFAGDHVLDLCATDESYRRRSVEHMQRVLAKTRSLRRFFNDSDATGVVTNIGGFSIDRALTDSEAASRRERLERSLAELDLSGSEIWPQTMPPYPWHFGGQRFHNLFVDADEIEAICSELGLGICLDISHSRLACTVRSHSFDRFVEQVAPYTRHLHVADAGGTDGEGLQIGDGEIDFPNLFRQLDTLAPRATFLPEIWQGHENDGQGFWVALERLEHIAKNNEERSVHRVAHFS